MKVKRKILTGIGIIFIIAVIAALALPILNTRTNCGGNSYALSACDSFVVAAEITAQGNHSQFEIGKIGKIEGQSLSTLAGNHWGMNGADFFIRTNFISGSNSNREIVVICQRQFGNVPQPTIRNFYRQNPAHAVGYSDGAIGLISPEQFTNLNLNGFVSLSDLATNSKFNIFK